MSRGPGLEPLECRHLLSVALAEIDSTLPADNTALLASPQQFTINFDPGAVNAVDDLYSGLFGTTPAQTLPAFIALDNNPNGDTDEFAIDQVGPGGVTTPVLGGASITAPLQATIATETDASGTTTQSQLIVTPAAGDPALLPGTYQLDLLPDTLLDAVFSTIDPSPVWTSSQPTAIAQFTILGQGETLADAINVGNIGPTTLSVSGFVNPQSSQTQVALYQFTLPAGHLWQLNTQVVAQSFGSPLQAGLALFDSNGNVIATRNSGEGHAPFRDDPFLIEGLAPGTYYVGISAVGNLPGPGWVNGYDLQTGTPGTAGFNASDGAFQLQLTATPAVGTTTVTSDSLDFNDPLESAPTGLNVTFSGPIDAAPLFTPDQQETALEVVDASGQVWPITATNYQTATNSVSFLFDEPLPAGSYSLVEPAQGGLTDLSGLPLVAPAGNPPGVLATWTVAPNAGPSDPDNLGVVWPGPANVTWESAISRTALLAPGQTIDYRFVAICPGIYSVQTQAITGQVNLEVTGANGTIVLDAKNLTGLNHTDLNLGVGVYSLKLTADGSEPAVVAWTLRPIALDYEKVYENGVGQASVLTLVTVPAGDSAAGATAFSGTTVDAASTATSGGSSAGSSLSTLTASPIPASLLVSMNTGLMGLPGTNAQNVAAVGPMTEGALASVADRVHGLLPGIPYASRSDAEARVGNGDPPEVLVVANDATADSREPANPEAASARNDGRALAQADRLVRIATWIEDVLGLPTGVEPAPQPAADGPTIASAVGDRGQSPVMLREPVTAGPDSRGTLRESIVLGDVRAPLGMIVAVAVAYRLRRPIEKWWRRKAPAAVGSLGRPHLHRPHVRVPHSRTIHAGTAHRHQMPRTPC